ncbi:MAG: ABC transporter substrate-binding protein [Xanthobacteraceae bacterium]|nr:ABC transporter substrate-binding protein [Xanthobacteraceae bacterium]
MNVFKAISGFRRSLPTILGAGACLAVLIGGSQPVFSAEEKELVFAGFGGSLQRALQATVIPAFEKKYGVKVIYVTGTSNQILAKVKAQRTSPQIDVIWANDTTHYQGKAEQLYAKLDPAKVPNLSQVYDFAKDPDGYGIVMGIQALGIEYNTQVFKEKGWAPPTSWMDFWDAKYKGHVVFYNMPIGYTNLLFLKIAELNGGSIDNLEPAWTKVRELIPNALAFVDPPAQVDALFGTGSAWIGFNGSARVHDFAGTGAPVAMVLPKEGGILYPQQFDIVANAPHPDLAQRFIDFTISPESQKQIAESMLLGPVNKTVKLDDAAAAKVPYGEKNVSALLNLNIGPINKDLQNLTARWTSLIGGH